MFSIYKQDRLEQEENRRIRTSANQPRKLERYLCTCLPLNEIDERDRMADKYKSRIVDFLEQAAVDQGSF